MICFTRGYTLLEVFISLAISSILFLGLLEAFTAARQAYRYVEGLALIQENGQLASYLLTQELSQTGYIGCRKIQPDFPLEIHLNNNDSVNLIHGYNATTLPASLKNIAQKVLPATSIIAIQFMQTNATTLITPIVSNYRLTVNNADLFEAKDPIAIADCLHADLTALVSVNKNILMTDTQLYDYPRGATVGVWQEEWFYLGNTARFNQAHQAIYALYLSQPNGRDEELVDNIANMRIQYGYLNAAQQLKFTAADQVKDWSAIKAVKILLLLNSAEPILTQPQIIKFDHSNNIAPDNKLYRPWEIIIPLLNR